MSGVIVAGLLGLSCLYCARSVVADEIGPTIDVWHGSSQTFGARGTPQRWVNVLGNVSDPDGVALLRYRLNGGPLMPLSIGPDARRLLMPGDFNVEIPISSLLEGINEVALQATDGLGQMTNHTVTLDFTLQNVWPLPHSLNWAGLTELTDEVQSVDGKWEADANGVRTVEVGYDRTAALGDLTWQDYMVTVPITVHSVDPAGYAWPSVSPGCGLILRWQGHWDWGGGSQPVIGYHPVGATLWYNWGHDGPLSLYASPGVHVVDNSGRQFDLGVTYVHKFLCLTIPGEGTLYRAKVWRDGDPEPASWEFGGVAGPSGLSAGSLLLVAHHVDVTYGDITVIPLDPDDPCAIDPDLDSDVDGVPDCLDGCPFDPDKTEPGGCGCGVPDTDSDEDGVPDCVDQCPGEPDVDSDDDGVADCLDECPLDPDKVEPGLCGCGVPDTDSDEDGEPDCLDGCPADPDKTEPGLCGCGVPESALDSDGDEVPDCLDGCPSDPDKTEPGICGCGVLDDLTDSDDDGVPDCIDQCPGEPDTDTDGDGVPDCVDGCPLDPDKTEPGGCGCGVADVDTDDDGVLDCLDDCPLDPDKTEPGVCGCGQPDVDSDDDGVLDCLDGCPLDPDKTEPGVCGCDVPDVDLDDNGIIDCLEFKPIFSDDFNAPTLNESVWTFVDPSAETTLTMTGFEAQIDVPAGESHWLDATTDTMPRLMQQVSDQDFDVEVKFESLLGSRFDVQGLLAEQNPGRFIKFDFFSDGTWVRAYVASIESGVTTTYLNSVIPAGSERYMRVRRTGALWEQWYSSDGSSWVPSVVFADSLQMTSLGVAVGNVSSGGPTAPAYTGVIDYFFNLDAPIDPEDGDQCPFDEAKTEPGICGCGVLDDPTDSDGDEVPDCVDGCPLDPDKSAPGICGCGVLDDPTDSDEDGTPDCVDGCPLDPDKTEPGICGCGVPDVDSDGDEVLDCDDACPLDPDKTEPGICGCGVPDADSDDDGVFDCDDGCPLDPDKTEPGLCGCGVLDDPTDSDEDGVPDCVDGCPLDPDKTAPGICGCGVLDDPTDSDEDGTPDCVDGCPLDPDKTEPGLCGCGVADTDSDGDEVPDCLDDCPLDPDKTEPGLCGCGVSDVDLDGDEVPDCLDECPLDPDKTEPGICGCGVPDTDFDENGIADCLEFKPIVSDDFNTLALNESLWTFIDPLGDSTLSMTGFEVHVGVPGGAAHWLDGDGDTMPRIMQQVSNQDFEIEVKFASLLGARFQVQGILVRQNAGRFLKLEFFSDGTSIRAYVASVQNGQGTILHLNAVIPAGSERYMRVKRTGDNWEQWYSSNGQSWGLAVAFAETLHMTSLGVVVGNVGSGGPTAPAHLGMIDYFFDVNAPIDPEDGDLCPGDPEKTEPGACGCGEPDTDSDEDGVPDCVDNCPAVPNPLQEDGNENGIGDACEAAEATSWQSVHTHGGSGEWAITLDRASEPAAATVEPRHGGVTRLLVAFDRPITLVGDVEAVDASTETAYPATATVGENDLSLLIEFAAGALPNGRCYRVDLGTAVESSVGLPLAGDTDCAFRLLVGDVNGDGVVDLADLTLIRTEVSAPLIAANAVLDLNSDGLLNLIDLGVARTMQGTEVECTVP